MSGVQDKIRFAFHLSVHPFDGFWDMKREKRGSMATAMTLAVLALFSLILSTQMTAFLFNPNKFAPMDLIFDITKYLLIFVVFCVANWSVTTLMQGEGTFRDILMMTGYCCMPLVLIPLPVAILSNLATFTEQVYLDAAITIAWIWFGFLLLSGVMTIHQYSLGKMIWIVVLTLVAMAAIVFIGLLFVNLFTQLIGFVFSIYKEMALRF